MAIIEGELVSPADDMSTAELMSYLNDVERDRFVKFQETFETAGWPLVVQIAQAKVVQHTFECANAKSWEEVCEARGARRAWEQVAAFADECMNSFANSAQLAKEDATEHPEVL
jgi:hypothetical protein